jgi:DNA-binding transcriptional MerR regulator
MLNSILTTFSIKDLENLSGVKAHTIRIWEKRYQLLAPDRTETNIRYYSIDSLRKLLNVVLLYNQGYKISKIGSLGDKELNETVQDHIATSSDISLHESSLIVSMFNFDRDHFNQIYNRLVSDHPFKKVFQDVLIPLLNKIGLYWQSDKVLPVHEHFISSLVMQKLQTNIERAQQSYIEKNAKVFVLFLPVNEIHELGLLYLHYELLINGYNSIYLGPSVPIDNLDSLCSLYNNITFLSVFTIQPESEGVFPYLKTLQKDILEPCNSKIWITGRKVKNITLPKSLKNIKLYKNIGDLMVDI